MAYIGELSALAAALTWAITSLLTENAAKKANSTDLNLFIKVTGFVLLSVIAALFGNGFFPTGVSGSSWFWLILSGIVGFALGDSFLFRAFHLIGAKVSLLIFSLAPVLTGILGWIFFGETLTLFNVVGMTLVLTGIFIVILEGSKTKIKFRFPIKGILIALLAALGQALGLILSKQGMSGYDAFTVSQVRLIGGSLALFVMIYLRRGESILRVFKDVQLTAVTLLNTLLGTVVGVTLATVAIANTKAAIASTLMAVTPIMVIPITFFFLKQKLDLREITGALLSVAGIAVLFIQ